MENPIEQINSPISLRYRFVAGKATTRFLHGLKEGKIYGQRCSSCSNVIVPPRGACARCGIATEEEVELSDKGTVTTFCVVHIPVPGSPVKPPFVSATILLDGANLGLFHLVADCKPSDVPFTTGLYFFYERGEKSDHGTAGRVVRIGNHPHSRNRLIGRLSDHYRTASNAKNGSVFRRYLGGALIRRRDPNR